MHLADGQTYARIRVPLCGDMFEQRRPDAAPAQLRPHGEVGEQQHVLAAVQLTDDPTEQRVAGPECDRGKRLRFALAAQPARHDVEVVELVGGERRHEDLSMEPIEQIAVVVAAERAEHDLLGRRGAHRDLRADTM